MYTLQIRSSTDDYEDSEDSKSRLGDSKSNLGETITLLPPDPVEPAEQSETYKPMRPSDTKPSPLQMGKPRPFELAQNGSRTPHNRNLSGGIQSPRPDVPRNQLLQRINSKKKRRGMHIT